MIGKKLSVEYQNLFEVFQDNLNRNPDSVLIEAGKENLSYDQLYNFIARVYDRVHSMDIEKGNVVSLFIPNGVMRVACVLALCKLGITFVPLDPLLTKAKMEYILEKSKVRYVFVGDDDGYRSSWRGYGIQNVSTLYVSDLLNPVIGTQENNNAHMNVVNGTQENNNVHMNGVNGTQENNNAHMNDVYGTQGTQMNGVADDEVVKHGDIFVILPTSGSTGNPKLVLLSHGNMLNRLLWYWEEFPYERNEVACSKTNFIFLDWITETLSPILKNESCLFLQMNDVIDTSTFMKYLTEYSVTRLVTVPSILKSIIDEKKAKNMEIDLKCVTCGSDMLLTSIVHEFLETFPSAVLTNVYGSTETGGDNIYKVFRRLEDINLNEEYAAIGYPMPNTKVAIWDENGRDIKKPNVTGEIVVSGLSISPGYLDIRAEDIEESCREKHPAVLLQKYNTFKTNDFGYYSEKNGFILIGRKDRVVKIRGQKVDLTEIECVIKDCFPKMGLFLTSKFIASSGTTKIFAFCVVDDGNEIKGKDIITKIKEQLPRYKLPKVILIPELPLNPISRKIDRLTLQNMIDSQNTSNDVLPRDQVEAMSKSDQLLYIASHVLNVDITPDDINASFFDLGGDSGTLMRFIGELNSFGFNMNVQTLMRAESLKCCLQNENSLMGNTDIDDVCNDVNFVSFADITEEELVLVTEGFLKQILESEPIVQVYKDVWDFKNVAYRAVEFAHRHYPEFCFAAKTKGKFIGAILSHPAHSELIDFTAYPEGMQELTAAAITEIIEKLFHQNYQVLSADFMYVDSLVDSKLRIAMVIKFNQLFIDIARDNNFNVIIAVVSSPALQTMNTELEGYKIEKIINATEFQQKNGEFPFRKFGKDFNIRTALKYLEYVEIH